MLILLLFYFTLNYSQKQNEIVFRAFVNGKDSTEGSCGDVPLDAMHLFRDATPGKSDLPWTGMVFGIAVSSIWYWCSDQVDILTFIVILNY